ncbi:MAG: hypothetical protein JXR76_26540 [Deltaproteobacteria bacterium]|nr:hypothetical protein [Deltaproteobacteria bacterium]
MKTLVKQMLTMLGVTGATVLFLYIFFELSYLQIESEIQKNDRLVVSMEKREGDRMREVMLYETTTPKEFQVFARLFAIRSMESALNQNVVYVKYTLYSRGKKTKIFTTPQTNRIQFEGSSLECELTDVSARALQVWKQRVGITEKLSKSPFRKTAAVISQVSKN